MQWYAKWKDPVRGEVENTTKKNGNSVGEGHEAVGENGHRKN